MGPTKGLWDDVIHDFELDQLLCCDLQCFCCLYNKQGQSLSQIANAVHADWEVHVSHSSNSEYVLCSILVIATDKYDPIPTPM